MKHLLILAAALPLIACGGATFESKAEVIDAGAAGDDGLSGAPAFGGSGGTTAGGTSVPQAGKSHGGAGVGAGGGHAAGAAGEAMAGASDVGGASGGGRGGSAGGTSAGMPGVGGSSGGTPEVGGTSGAGSAGSGGTAGAPPAPTCTETEAFGTASLPDAFLMPAWTTTNASDKVCWHGDDRVCTFTVKEFKMVDSTHGSLSIDQITCDKPLYGGTLYDGTCKDMTDCQVLQGSVADEAVVEFVMAPSGNGYVAGSFDVRAAASSGGLLNCDISASTLGAEIGARVSDMIASLSFVCE